MKRTMLLVLATLATTAAAQEEFAGTRPDPARSISSPPSREKVPVAQPS